MHCKYGVKIKYLNARAKSEKQYVNESFLIVKHTQCHVRCGRGGNN